MSKTSNVKVVPFNMADPALIRDPYRFYKALRENSPIFLSSPDNNYFLTRYADIDFVLANQNVFSVKETLNILQPAWLNDIGIKNYPIVYEEPPQHTLHRQAINKAYTQNVINKLLPYIKQAACELIEAIPIAQEVDFVTTVAEPLVDRTALYQLGIDYSTYELNLIRQWTELVENPPLLTDTSHKNKLQNISTKVSTIIDSTMQPREKSPRNDLISLYIAQDTALSHSEKCSITEMLLLATIQATPHIISRAVMYMAHDEKIFKQLSDDFSLIPKFIEELLRYDPPVHLAVRKVLSDAVISDTPIPKGSNVILILASANRDSNQFQDADGFDIHRHNNSHVAFGRGIHHCLGKIIARKITAIALETLLSHFKRFNSESRDKIKWSYSYAIYGFKKLNITFE